MEAALYDTDRAIIAECFTFILAGGTYYWTSAGYDVVWDGHTFLAGQVGIRRGKIQRYGNARPDKMNMTMGDGGVFAVVQAALSAAFDNAGVKLERVYIGTGGTPIGAILELSGIVTENKPVNNTVELTVESILAAAPSVVPTRAVSARCSLAVYSAECGATPIEATATVAAGSTASTIQVVSVPAAAAVGSWVTLAGGVTSRIASIQGLAITLNGVLAAAPAAGTTITIRRACPKDWLTCSMVFNRGGSFTGSPWAPAKQPG